MHAVYYRTAFKPGTVPLTDVRMRIDDALDVLGTIKSVSISIYICISISI